MRNELRNERRNELRNERRNELRNERRNELRNERHKNYVFWKYLENYSIFFSTCFASP